MGVDHNASAKGCERSAACDEGHGPALILGVLCLPRAGRGRRSKRPAGTEKYTLRYKFEPGQSLRWKVVHRCRVRTTVSGTTQTAETVSISEKVWRVKRSRADGSATFEHLVEWVDMRQQLTGANEVHYDSRTDLVPPHGFENLAQSVGVPLSIVTLDARGKVVERKRIPVKAAVGGEGEMTVCLPEEPVAVGPGSGRSRTTSSCRFPTAASARSRRGSPSPCWGSRRAWPPSAWPRRSSRPSTIRPSRRS